MIETVDTDRAPRAIGPYSQAKVFGNLVFTSGQIGIDPETNELKKEFREEVIQVMENIKAVLEASGTGMENVVKTTVYLIDIKDFNEMNTVYAEYFPQKPARSTIQVCKLPRNARIEIDVISVRN